MSESHLLLNQYIVNVINIKLSIYDDIMILDLTISFEQSWLFDFNSVQLLDPKDVLDDCSNAKIKKNACLSTLS